MTLGLWLYGTFLFVCIFAVGLAVDYSQSIHRGWTPAYKILLFWQWPIFRRRKK